MSAAPPIANLLAFEAVARRRSFALAAAELHVTASAVSRQVAKLESQLGVRLFKRTAHAVLLTTSGETYLSRLSGALAAITSATEDLRFGIGNSLYVHSAPSIASLWLMPRLRSFSLAHPEISLNLSASHSQSDFELGRVDVDIRYGIPSWPDLEIETLFDEPVLPLASPGFVAEGKQVAADDAFGLPLIQSSVSVVQWSDWFSRFSAHAAPERFALCFDRAQLSLDAASQGLGVALESATMAAGHLADGRLAPLCGWQKSLTVQAHFCVYPAEHLERPAVVIFLAWLRREAAACGRHGHASLAGGSVRPLSTSP